MSFRFEPATEAIPWTHDRYRLFLDAVAESYPRVEEMTRHSIRVGVSKRQRKPEIKEIAQHVIAVRAFTEDGLRAVQLTPDGLLVNYLHGESNPYPGFATLLDEALAHCRRYIECYQPNGVQEAALHYIDVIELPVPENGIIRTERYLNIDFKVPEIFGHFSAFDLNVVARPPNGDSLVQLGFATESGKAGNSERRFRLEWHTPVKTGALMTEEELRSNLQVAHDRLWTCFRHTFTEEGWARFEPEEP